MLYYTYPSRRIRLSYTDNANTMQHVNYTDEMCDCCTCARDEILSELAEFKHELNEKLNMICMQNIELKTQIKELKTQLEVKPAPKPIRKSINGDDFAKCEILCKENKSDELKIYLDGYCDVVSKEDSKLLCIAARNGSSNCVKLLLERGADVHAQDDGANIHAQDDGAIRYAAENGHLECVKLLIIKGADVHIENDFAIRYAAKNGHTECVKFLITANANVHAQDDFAVCWAAHNGNLECVKLLITANANVHAENDYAIRWAAKNGHLECVKLLHSHNADIHAQDDYAIRWAAMKNHFDVVQYLAENGANVLAKDSDIINDLFGRSREINADTKKIVAIYLARGGDEALNVAKSYMRRAIEDAKFNLADIFHECGVVLKKESDPKLDKYFV